jgi:ketosteroid isomerase-like protein
MTDPTLTAAIPAIITRYVEAANRHDFEAVAACFATEATVRDEGMDIAGREAIRAWKQRVTQKYSPVTVIRSAERQQDGFRVEAEVAGTFPGSPVNLSYDFVLEEGLIRRLSIA